MVKKLKISETNIKKIDIYESVVPLVLPNNYKITGINYVKKEIILRKLSKEEKKAIK